MAAVLVSPTGHHDHPALYRLRGAFRDAAFPGRKKVSLWRATFEEVRRGASRTLLVQGERDLVGALLLAQRSGISIHGTGLLMTEQRRQRRDPPATLRALRRFGSDILGFNVLGSEAGSNDNTLHEVLDLLLAHRPQGYLLLHAGERDLHLTAGSGARDGGRWTVNRYLRALEERSREDPGLERLTIMIAHAAHIADVEAARRDLERLAARGVVVWLNPQPPSNLVYATVPALGEIDAFRLAWPFVAHGSDNVGTLAFNRRMVSLLTGGAVEAAEALAVSAGLYARRVRWPQVGDAMSRADPTGSGIGEPEMKGHWRLAAGGAELVSSRPR